MSTPQERAEEQRRKKLAEVDKQIRDGSLVVRQMTEEERARYGPRPEPPPRARSKRRSA
jgi:hypothetical protein